MRIEPLVCLSTAHLSLATAEALQSDDWPMAVYPNEYGAFVLVPDPQFPELCAEVNEHLYPDLLFVIRWAQAEGLQWIKFDGSGQVLGRLPVFKWA